MKTMLCLTLALFVTLYLLAGKNQLYQTESKKFNSKDTTIEGNWQLQPVLPSDTVTGKLPKLSFNLDNRKFNGYTGCNSMSGSFLIHGDSLSFNEQIVTTRMICEGYNEKAFIDNLTKVNRYKVADDVLQLMNDQTILSKWVRVGEKKMKKI